MGTGYVWSLWHRSFGLAAQLLRFTLSDDNRHTEQRQPDGLDNRRGAQRIRLAIDVRFFWRACIPGNTPLVRCNQNKISKTLSNTNVTGNER